MATRICPAILVLDRGPTEIEMRKRSVTARIEEGRLRVVGRYLKTRRPSETVRAAVDFIAERAAHEGVIRKYSGVGGPDAFRDS